MCPFCKHVPSGLKDQSRMLFGITIREMLMNILRTLVYELFLETYLW